MKKRKEVISYESICACFPDYYISLEDAHFELITRPNQERDLIKKELTLNLSKEAVYVLRLLFTSPVELIDSLSASNYKRPTKNSLHSYLFRRGWQHKIIEETFRELREYSQQLNFST